MKNILFSAIILFSICGCHSSSDLFNVDASQGIIGGGPLTTDSNLYRYVLALKTIRNEEAIDENGNGSSGINLFKCSASALSAKVVISAAHCLTNKDITRAIVYVDSNKKVFKTYVKNIIIHPDYQNNGDKDSDLAILFLEESLPAEVGFVEVSPSDSQPFSEIIAAGFGLDQGLKSPLGKMGSLRSTTLRLLEAQSLASEKTFIVNQQEGTGICKGDSGGPALRVAEDKVFLIGVASKVQYPLSDSTIDPCAYQGLYINTQFFNDWILSNLTSDSF